MPAFINPKVWVPNETVTADKLNLLGAALTNYINLPSIDTPQLVCKYSDLIIPWYKDDTGVLAGPVPRSFFFTPPAANQPWQVPSVGWPANGSSRTGVKMRTR